MNREIVLECIHRHVRQSDARVEDLRPLGELVPVIAAELRDAAPNNATSAEIVPVQSVAAFVDGKLNAEEENTVCRALLTDNSVLAELIASVRAQNQLETALQTPSVEPDVSPTLDSRLTDLVGQHFADASSTPDTDLPALESSAPKVATRPSTRRWFLIGSFAAAACLILAAWIGWQFLSSDSKNIQQIVEGEERPSEDSSFNIAKDETEPTMDRLEPEVTNVPAIDPPPIEQVAEQNPSLPTPDAVRDPASIASNPPKVIEPPKAPIPTPEPEEPRIASTLESLAWNEIHGLLAQKTSSVRERSATDSSSESEVEYWGRVEPEQPVYVTPPANVAYVVQTLPFSRASSSSSEGGKLVLGPDSQIKLTRQHGKPTLELAYGEMMIESGAPAERTLELKDNRGRIANLQWTEPGTAFATYGPSGLQLNIREGILEIDGRPFSETSVALNDTGVVVVTKNLRLPRWTSETQGLMPKHVLAQFEDADNLTLRLQERIRTLSQDQRNVRDVNTFAALAQIQASLADKHLLRLVGNRNEILKKAAVSRLLSLPSWDPRFDNVWQKTGQARTDMGLNRLRNFVVLAQQGTLGLNHAQPLIRGLNASDASSRVLYHALLLKIAKGGPAFDANWPLQQRARSVAAWEKYLGLR